MSGVFAQDKLLSSKQLMSRALYPLAKYNNLQFVGSTNNIAYLSDTMIYMGSAKSPKPLVSIGVLNKALCTAGEKEARWISDITFVNEKEFMFSANGKLYSYNLTSHSLSLLADRSSAEHLDYEPVTRQYAYTEGNNLYVNTNGKVLSIEDPNVDIVFGQSVHRNEFGIEKGTFWSPKGAYLAFYRMDQSMVTDYPMVNTSSRIATPSPFKYPMAGMKSHEVTVGIYSSKDGQIHYLQTCKDTTIAEREMYLTNLTWSPDESYLYIAKLNRGQNHMWLERYDVASGKLDKVLFEETNERYVEPCEGLYFIPNHPDQFLWFSLRDGYKHLYLYNSDGSLLKQLTHGEYEVESLIAFDAKGENVFISANKDNLAGCAAYKVNIASGEMIRLTPLEGTHSVQVSADGNCILDEYSTKDIPLIATLSSIKGKKSTIQTLYCVDNPLADYAMPTFNLGTIKAADGKTDLYYRLITPPNMDSNKKYPTLVYVYGGPHSQLVTDSWLLGGNLYFTFLAQQGYIIFTLDNRGTDNRGFEFESCTHRQLGVIEMADQMEGVKFLQSLPYVDQDRMGVEGWSFGGFMTITMKLAHPEIFKVGCAGGPVIDWKWYEVMYGERYMDMPQENPEGYFNSSLVNKAGNLEGRLLVIHGAEDNTVVWQNSIEFLQSCIKSGKLVDYFIYPHHEHNVRGIDRVHLYEKMFDYYETFLK